MQSFILLTSFVSELAREGGGGGEGSGVKRYKKP